MRRADNLTIFMCRLSWNLGASAFWNPLCLPRPVMGLLYFYLYLLCAQSNVLCSKWNFSSKILLIIWMFIQSVVIWVSTAVIAMIQVLGCYIMLPSKVVNIRKDCYVKIKHNITSQKTVIFVIIVSCMSSQCQETFR